MAYPSFDAATSDASGDCQILNKLLADFVGQHGYLVKIDQHMPDEIMIVDCIAVLGIDDRNVTGGEPGKPTFTGHFIARSGHILPSFQFPSLVTDQQNALYGLP